MTVPARSVLVVEDEPAVRGFVSLLLEDEGYTVNGATNGKEALASLQRNPPDALIVDLDLPIMNGHDLVRACRDDAAVCHIPIIAISAMYTDCNTRDLDVQGFLLKPFSLEALLRVLNRALG